MLPEEALKQIMQGEQVREALSALREMLRSPETAQHTAQLLKSAPGSLHTLLENPDPKVRKNAARLLGELETEESLPFLFAAWKEEKTLFVRADYVNAMCAMDCRSYLPQLRERARLLESADVPEEDRKHIREERLALARLLGRYEEKTHHRFIVADTAPEVILLTNRENREATASQIGTGEKTLVGAGVRLRGGSMEELLSVRTWSQLLFPVPHGVLPDLKPAGLGEAIAGLDIPAFLDDWHTGRGQWKYRLEVKDGSQTGRKGVMIRRISEALDRCSAGRMLNSPSDYEAEIRLIHRKDGTWLVFLALFTIPDRRFAYRKESVAASMAPVNAALVMQLAKPWLKEGAQVLDPFCGVGTMLIERAMCLPAGDMYGVDLFGEAIEKARSNTAVIGLPVHYINRDFFDFTHAYAFDEVITDLPRYPEEERNTAVGVYRGFFERIPSFLADEAVLVLCSCEAPLIRSILKNEEQGSAFTICLEKTILDKAGMKMLVIKYVKKG